MIDHEKFIAAQAILKSLIESLPNIEDDNLFYGRIRARFQHATKIAEEYATVDEGDEYINTGVRVPKAYWDTRDASLLNGNIPRKVEEKGWFIFARRKDIAKFKTFIETTEVIENGF